MKKNKGAAKKQRTRKPKVAVKQQQRPKATAARPSKVVKLVKPPKDAVRPKGQGGVILDVLAEAGGQLTVDELIAKLEGRIITKNVLGLRDVVHMCAPVLLARGFVKEESQ